MKEWILVWIFMVSVIATIAICNRLETINKNIETVIKLENAQIDALIKIKNK